MTREPSESLLALVASAEFLDIALRRDGEWYGRAACRGASLAMFFVERPEDADDAKEVCSRCPVSMECLASSLIANERSGIWGGVAEAERRRLRKVFRAALSERRRNAA